MAQTAALKKFEDLMGEQQAGDVTVQAKAMSPAAVNDAAAPTPRLSHGLEKDPMTSINPDAHTRCPAPPGL